MGQLGWSRGIYLILTRPFREAAARTEVQQGLKSQPWYLTPMSLSCKEGVAFLSDFFMSLYSILTKPPSSQVAVHHHMNSVRTLNLQVSSPALVLNSSSALPLLLASILISDLAVVFFVVVSRPELVVKKLRYYARFIVVCLLLNKMDVVKDLVKVC